MFACQTCIPRVHRNGNKNRIADSFRPPHVAALWAPIDFLRPSPIHRANHSVAALIALHSINNPCIFSFLHSIASTSIFRRSRSTHTPRSFNTLPFFELRRPGELVDGWSTTPVLVPGLTLVFERRVRHVAGPLLNFHRCWPSAPPWRPIYRRPHSLVTSQAFAVQARRMGLNLVDPPLSAPAALPESLLHDPHTSLQAQQSMPFSVGGFTLRPHKQ